MEERTIRTRDAEPVTPIPVPERRRNSRGGRLHIEPQSTRNELPTTDQGRRQRTDQEPAGKRQTVHETWKRGSPSLRGNRQIQIQPPGAIRPLKTKQRPLSQNHGCHSPSFLVGGNSERKDNTLRFDYEFNTPTGHTVDHHIGTWLFHLL